MQVTITIDVAPEYVDDADSTGLTNAGYEALMELIDALTGSVAESIVSIDRG